MKHLSLFLPLALAAGAVQTQAADFTLQILHASDFEGDITALEEAPRFSSVLEALKKEYPANTIVLSSGGSFIPGPFYTASADPGAPYNGVKGRGDISIMNALGIQAAALGNAEFDDNTPQLRSVLVPDTAVSYPGAQFPYLSANLNLAPDASLADLAAPDGQDWTAVKGKIAKSAVVTTSGQKIGLVGITTPELRTISSPGNVEVLTNLVAEAQKAVDALTARGINKIILLSHLQGFEEEYDLAPRLNGVDVIIAGGNQAVFARPGTRIREGDIRMAFYPIPFTSLSGQPTYVVNTGPNYRYVGRFIPTFNEEGIITSFGPGSTSYPTDAQGVADTGNEPPAPAIVEIVAKLGSIINTKDASRFGRTTYYIDGFRDRVRTQETTLGNLTADANLRAGQLADPTVSISLKNGGGILDSIGASVSLPSGTAHVPPPANPSVGKQAGEISRLDIENSLRFNNGLSLLTITAQQLRDALEWGVAGSELPLGQFPQVGGIAFSFQPTNAPMTYIRGSNGAPAAIDFPGERLRSLVVFKNGGGQDLVVENGQVQGNPNRAFRAVMIDFLAVGGDSYLALSQGTDRRPLLAAGAQRDFDTPGTEQKALADYLTHIRLWNTPDTSPAADNRIQNLSARADGVTAPKIYSVAPAIGASGAVVRFSTIAGKQYELRAADNVTGPWQTRAAAITGNGQAMTLTDPEPQTGSRFYQVVIP